MKWSKYWSESLLFICTACFFAVCFWIKQRKRNLTLCNKNKSIYAVKNVKSTEIGRRSIVSNKQKKQKTKDCC